MANAWSRSVVAALLVGSVSGCLAGARKVESSGAGVKASGVAVAEVTAAEATPPHPMVRPSAIKWKPFPPGSPGVMIAVLAGDPEKSGPFVLRIKSPAGAKVPPHWHPTDENITVIAGTIAMGMGDKFDPKALQVLPVGSYTLMPRETRHFALSKTATVVQVHGAGPFQVNFVNPADDPRLKR
jgi:quercetin dioxygenase-like cupin family protein